MYAYKCAYICKYMNIYSMYIHIYILYILIYVSARIQSNWPRFSTDNEACSLTHVTHYNNNPTTSTHIILT